MHRACFFIQQKVVVNSTVGGNVEDDVNRWCVADESTNLQFKNGQFGAKFDNVISRLFGGMHTFILLQKCRHRRDK